MHYCSTYNLLIHITIKQKEKKNVYTQPAQTTTYNNAEVILKVTQHNLQHDAELQEQPF